MKTQTILILGALAAVGLLVVRKASASSAVRTLTPDEFMDYNYTVTPGGAAYTGAATGDIYHPGGIFKLW